MLDKLKELVKENFEIVKLILVVVFAMLFTIVATGYSKLKKKLKDLRERYYRWRQK